MTRENKKYSIIYADPPWTYKVWSNKGKGRSAESHYPCMTKSEIQNLPVQNICKSDAVLFLWVTYPCLLEGLELIKAWGFEYKTCVIHVLDADWMPYIQSINERFKQCGKQ